MENVTKTIRETVVEPTIPHFVEGKLTSQTLEKATFFGAVSEAEMIRVIREENHLGKETPVLFKSLSSRNVTRELPVKDWVNIAKEVKSEPFAEPDRSSETPEGDETLE